MKLEKRNIFKGKTLFVFALFFLPSAYADSEVGRLALVNGDVKIAQDENAAGTPAKPNDVIKNDQVVKTGTDASAKILFSDQSIMDLGPNSAFKVSNYALKNVENRTASFNLLYGKLRALVTHKVGPSGKVEVKSAGTVMGVRGTEFVVDTPKPPRGAPPIPPTVTVVTGIVQVQAPTGQVFAVNAGQMADSGAATTASSSTSGSSSESSSGSTNRSASADKSKGGEKSSPVKQASSEQIQQSLGSAKTQDNTFSNTLNLSGSGSKQSQASTTMTQLGTMVSTVNVPPPASESGQSLSIAPTSATQLTNFLPPVNIVPGNLVNVSISVQ